MASSLPILFIGEGEASSRILDRGCGLVVPPGDAAGLRGAFVKLATNPQLRADLGARGRAAAESKYNRAQIAARLDGFLRSLL